MIIPSKHIKLSNSALGIGSTLLENLEDSQTVSTLWERTKKLNGVRNFGRFTLALDLLFLLGLIDFKEGLIIRCKNDS